MNSADVTVLMSTSPIPAHPSTEFIDAALEHVRFWFPDAPIVIMADGIWEGVAHRTEQYKEYLVRLRQKYHNKNNIVVKEFALHAGQAAMTAVIINNVLTKYILFNEHDVVIDTDKPIDWDLIISMMDTDRANVVRLSGFVEGIHPEHMHLTVGSPEDYDDVMLWRTIQWSQWPHIAKTSWYKRLLMWYTKANEPQMIEEVMQSVLQSKLRWDASKTWVYAPKGNAVRIHHLDARFYDEKHKDPCFWQS